MSRLVLISIAVVYLTIGLFVSGVLDDYDHGPDPMAVLLWPVLTIIIVLLVIVWGIYKLGKKIGDLIFGR